MGVGSWELTKAVGRVSLVGAGPGDPELWTVRALKRVEDADLVLYDALVNAEALRTRTAAQCFCVGKRAGRASVTQETINGLMIRAARQGKRVVRLKGGDPFVFGRGAEEALALAHAGIAFEIVPGVTTAVAAPELAGIPVTHRGMASAFLVLAGRGELATRLIAHGWSAETRAAVVCGASTSDEWTWTGHLSELESVAPPDGVPGVVVVGEVVQVRDALEAAGSRQFGVDEVKYGRS